MLQGVGAHTIYIRNNMGQKCESYLLNSTADSAQFEWKWAGLAVLFSRYLPNGTHDLAQNFRICFFKDFIKNPQTTIALTFLTHIISGIDGVICISLLQLVVPRINFCSLLSNSIRAEQQLLPDILF